MRRVITNRPNVRPNVRTACQGVTLIEILIGSALGIFLLSGIIQIFLSAKQVANYNRDVSLMQENARFAIEYLTRETRMAGYFGCNTRTIANTLNPMSGGQTGWQLNFDQGLGGYDGDDANFPNSEFPSPPQPAIENGTLPNTDVFTVHKADTLNDSYTVAGHNPNSAVIDIDGTHAIPKGNIMIISDCRQTAVFQTTGNNPQKFGHNKGGSVSPGNCTKGLGYPVACTTNGNSYEYRNDAYIRRAVAQAYYVDIASNGVPALFARELTDSTNTQEAELVQGIENIQTLFGQDTNGDSVPNRFVPASDVTDWTAVTSLRVHVLTRSASEIATEPTPFRFLGDEHTPQDRYLRMEFSATINLRNREA